MKTTRELQPRERACANAHHDLPLEILLILRKCLIHNMSLVEKYTQGTNFNYVNGGILQKNQVPL